MSIPPSGGRAVGHHHHAVGEEQRLVDVVGDHQRGLAVCAPESSSTSCSSKRVSESSMPNGSSSSSTFGIERERAREADALAHARRQLGRPLVHRVAEADQRRGSASTMSRALGARRLRRASPRRRASRCRRRSSTAAGTATGTPRRGPGPGPVISRPSSTTPPASDAVQPGDDREHRRLAAAGVADQADELALADRRSRSPATTRLCVGSERSWRGARSRGTCSLLMPPPRSSCRRRSPSLTGDGAATPGGCAAPGTPADTR